MRQKQNRFQWEYWSPWFFYLPNIPFAFYHALKAKNLVFYTAANPSIENAGIGTESKYKTQQLIPKKYLAKTILHLANSDASKTLEQINKLVISYPLIVKPDIGFRGLLVQKIYSESALLSYLKKYPIDVLIQEFLTEKNECGIFYFRHPSSKKGQITSLTLKDFLAVIGNGEQTVLQLVQNNNRAKRHADWIKKNRLDVLTTVPKNGERIQLSDIGNHSKGTQFLNGNHLICDQLESALDTVNSQINGWFYGRLDIKYNSLADLMQGNFKILELNGILAEPTHIYDATKSTYWQALRELRKHWKQLYIIARFNHDKKNIPYRSTIGLLKDVHTLKKYTKKMSRLSQIP